MTTKQEQFIKMVTYISAEVLGVGPKQIAAKTRKGKELIMARFISQKIVRDEMPELSLNDIGTYFCRDHASVLYGVRQATLAIEGSGLVPPIADWKEKYETIMEKVKTAKTESRIFTGEQKFFQDSMEGLNKARRFLENVGEFSMSRNENHAEVITFANELINRYR